MTMPNTPRLPKDVEKRFDEICFYEDDDWIVGKSMVLNAEHLGDVSGKLIPKIKQLLAQELATLKTQVRKEIEEEKVARDINEPDDLKIARNFYNQALTDCLSIKSLEEE